LSPPFTSTGRFEISRVLSRLFGVLGRNFGRFLLSAAILVGLPMVALGFFQMVQINEGGPSGDPTLSGVSALAVGLVSLVTTTVLQAAIIHGSVEDLNGRPASVVEGLIMASGRALPLIGLSLAVGLVTAFGLLLLIVPGVLVALAFSVAVPALMVERRGVFDAMQRSRDLTRNHRGAVFGLFVLYLVAAMIVQLAGSITAGVAGASGISNFIAINGIVVTPVVQMLSSLLLAVGTASIYYELRFIKEGVGPEALARVFD